MSVTREQMLKLRQLYQAENQTRIDAVLKLQARVESVQGWHRWQQVENKSKGAVPRVEADVTWFDDNSVEGKLRLICPLMFGKEVLEVQLGHFRTSDWKLQAELRRLDNVQSYDELFDHSQHVFQSLMGGAWDALVKSLKLPLKAKIGNKHWGDKLWELSTDGSWTPGSEGYAVEMSAEDSMHCLTLSEEITEESFAEDMKRLEEQEKLLEGLCQSYEAMLQYSAHACSQPHEAIPQEDDPLPAPRLELRRVVEEEYHSDSVIVLVTEQGGWHVRVPLMGSSSHGPQSDFTQANPGELMSQTRIRDLPGLRIDLCFLAKAFNLPAYIVVGGHAYHLQTLDPKEVLEVMHVHQFPAD